MQSFKGLFYILIYYDITFIIVEFSDFWMVLHVIHALFDKLSEG